MEYWVFLVMFRGVGLMKESLELDTRVHTNKDNGIIIIIDSRIGMTREEIVDCIGTIAPSGALSLGAARKVADISKGSNVAIFGLGTVGLSVAQGARLRGASRIIGVDTNRDKYEKGKAFGMADFINPADCDEPVQQDLPFLYLSSTIHIDGDSCASCAYCWDVETSKIKMVFTGHTDYLHCIVARNSSNQEDSEKTGKVTSAGMYFLHFKGYNDGNLCDFLNFNSSFSTFVLN